MPTLYPYRLFISHAWSYNESYERLISFLQSANNFTFRNYSVPKENAFQKMSMGELKEELRCQIRPVGCVIIIGGMYVAHSDWIQFEIDYAKLLSKPIIGVQPWGSERMPIAVSSAADIIVGWNTDSIVQAIRNYSN